VLADTYLYSSASNPGIFESTLATKFRLSMASGQHFDLTVGDGITEEKAAQLKPGGKLLVTAEVVSVSLVGADKPNYLLDSYILVTLKNLRVATDTP
jgi:hypothetical protein